MAVNMTSKIVLAKDIRLDRAHENVVDLSANDMLTVMNSLSHYVASASDFSFIRATGTLKADINYDSALIANYLAFQNPSYSNKWFFAFIDKIEYKGENCIEIYYTVDNWQTWFKDLTILPTFVEREHTNDDTKGNNLLPEPNGCQTFTINSDPGHVPKPGVSRKRFKKWFACVVSVSDNGSGNSCGYLLNETMPCACTIKTFDLCIYDPLGVNPPTPSLGNLMAYLDTLGGDYGTIVNIFCYPADLIDMHDTGSITSYAYTVSKSGNLDGYNFLKASKLNGYTPKNNKMLTYPYCWLEVSTGEKTAQFRYEFFASSVNCEFELVGGATPIPEINLYALNYKNYITGEKNPANKLSLNNFPQIALPIDSYKAWLAQSSSAQLNSILRGMGTSMITGGISGGVSGAMSGAASSGVNGIANYLNSEEYAQDASDTYKGSNTASLDQALGLMGFDILHYAADAEEARCMDHFLSMFGYTTRRVKVPNITGRTYWNYIKINGVLGHGPVPAGALEDINNIANKGVTIWHSHDNVGNYTVGDSDLANPIVTP